MKKRLVSVFLSVVLIVCMMPTVFASAAENETPEDLCSSLAINYLKAYYAERYSSDTDGVFDYELKTENEYLKSYLEQRSYADNTPKRFGRKYTDYKSEFSVVNVVRDGTFIYCSVASKISYYDIDYYNVVSERPSGCGTETLFTFIEDENGEWLLYDLYEFDKSFDISIRGIIYNFDEYMKKKPHIDCDYSEKTAALIDRYEKNMERYRKSLPPTYAILLAVAVISMPILMLVVRRNKRG